MSGMVTGGWNFVIAAYVISAFVLGGYALRVLRDHVSRVTRNR